MFKEIGDGVSLEEAKPYRDYIVHKILQLAGRYSLLVQIHTGIQEGNTNLLSNSNPLLLNNPFLEYNDVVFDIFHAGYPWFREVGVLAKMFPNVYVDMCWFHAISPHDAREALSV